MKCDKILSAIIISAVMCSANAASQCTEDTEEETGPACALYDVKFTLKTLLPKQIKCSDSKEYYFDQGSRTFEGVIWDCDAACATMAPGEDVKFVMWEAKRKIPVTVPLHSDDGYWAADITTFDIMDRFSKKANKVECFWPIDCDDIKLYASGFGTFDLKNDYVLNVSGNVAGKIVPAMVTSTTVNSGLCGDGIHSEAFPAKLLPLCDEFSNWCDDGDDSSEWVAAFGTWSIKYNKRLSTGKKPLNKIVPAYAQSASMN